MQWNISLLPSSAILFSRQGHVLFINADAASPQDCISSWGHFPLCLGSCYELHQGLTGSSKVISKFNPIVGGIRGDLGSELVRRVLPVTCQTAWMCAGGFVSSALAAREFGNKVLSWKQISNILPWLWSSQPPELGEINF